MYLLQVMRWVEFYLPAKKAPHSSATYSDKKRLSAQILKWYANFHGDKSGIVTIRFMATKRLITKAKKSPYGSNAPIQRRPIESRDLNEDEQQQLTNFKQGEEGDKNQRTDSNDQEDQESKTTVEQEEDNEQLRREDEERGNEQV